MRGVALGLVMAGLLATRGTGAAHPQAPATPQFEVASVKENKSDERRVSRRFLPGGRVEITNFPLRMLIGFAHGIDARAEEFRLTGGPDSLLAGRFDITAVAPADPVPTPADLMAMLRTLLVDRFALKAHTESRQLPVYALTVAQAGRLGPGLRPSQHNCREWAGSPLDTEPRDENGRGLCGASQLERVPGGSRRRYAGTVATLAQLLQRQAPELSDRRVVDMTGLTGDYQWEFTYSQSWGPDSPPGNDLPSIFTALREQLGLKLEPKTAPVEVLVIDSVSLPSPN